MKRLLNVGVSPLMPKHQARAIILTNTIALIAALLTTGYFLFSLRQGLTRTGTIVLCMMTAQYSILVLNYVGLNIISRIILSMTIPVGSLIALFLPRIANAANITYSQGPGVYTVLVATSVIPILVFSKREKKLMFLCVIINFFLFASLDIFLRLFSKLGEVPGVGVYITTNLALIIAYILLIASVLSLKRIVDDFETRNEQLISNLNDKNLQLELSNRELFQLNQDIESQNKEIQAQSEELIQGQESLMLAHNEIERQKIELEKSLDEKSLALMHSNQQLVSQNNELQQFSYTVSHNLRGPVASMLGLVNLHYFAGNEAERLELIRMIEQSAKSLETIIRDLSKIVDIRNDKFSAFEKISLDNELHLIRESLSGFIISNDVELSVDFQCREITSIKAYINSILYNLLTNAIQYRSPNRRPHIRITSVTMHGYVHLTVSDNGLGIDLSKFSNDLFKLYKRFHLHTQGKGLGLYIVKQQVEKLNGKIEVESRPDFGTTFHVVLPQKN